MLAAGQQQCEEVVSRRLVDTATAQAVQMMKHHACESDADEADLARARTLHERLSRSDRALLLQCKFAPVDIDRLDVDAHSVLWLVYQKLMSVWVDPMDRVFIRTSILGSAVAGLDGQKPVPGKRGRPRKTAAAG